MSGNIASHWSCSRATLSKNAEQATGELPESGPQTFNGMGESFGSNSEPSRRHAFRIVSVEKGPRLRGVVSDLRG